jgi:hypothetical protein
MAQSHVEKDDTPGAKQTLMLGVHFGSGRLVSAWYVGYSCVFYSFAGSAPSTAPSNEEQAQMCLCTMAKPNLGVAN